MSVTEIYTLVVQSAVFGIVAALWLFAVVLWVMRRGARARAIERRLDISPQPSEPDRILRLWHDGRAVETAVPRYSRQSLAERLERIREDAGWSTPMPQVLMLLGFAVMVGTLLVYLLTGNPLLVLATAAVILIGFRANFQRCLNKRTALFEKQLADALELGARSLRAGHPLSGAFRLVANEINPPLGLTFAEVCDQEELGVSIQRSLQQVAARSRSADMKIFAASVIIQLRSGGNLADMMERVTWVVRERMRLNRRARVLTAEAQLSKWILLALPLGMLVLLSLMNPDYMRPLYNTLIGSIMLTAGGIMMMIGAWIMNRMARIKY